MSNDASMHEAKETFLQGLKTPAKFGLVAALLTAAITFFLPNYYQSQAKILPSESKGSNSLGQLAAAAAAIGVGFSGQDSGDSNFVDILDSRSIREDLLSTRYKFKIQSWRFGREVQRDQTLYEYLDAKNMDRAVKALDKVLFVSRDIKSRIITVSADTKSPELSRFIVQQATRDLEKFVGEKSRTRGSEKAKFAEARLMDARRELSVSEDAFRQFLEGNRNYQTSADPSVRLRGLRFESDLRLKQQIVTTLSVSREQALMEEKNDIPIVNILDPANQPIEKSHPQRSKIVLFAFLGVFVCTWVWRNREWVRARLLDADEAKIRGIEPKKEIS